jgi:hypothetical protein
MCQLRNQEIGTLSHIFNVFYVITLYTNRKENQVFLMYKETQSGAVAKSNMRKCANISPYMRRLLVIYDFATSPF